MRQETLKDTPLQNGLKEHSARLNYVIDLFQVVTDFSSFIQTFIILTKARFRMPTCKSFSYIPENAWITQERI